jgi:hypothetical protein
VLEYKLFGYWSVAEAEEWLSAVAVAVAARPPGKWYILGDSTQAKAQSAEVNAIRSRIADITQDAGLAGAVLIVESATVRIQSQRLISKTAHPELYTYVLTPAEAEQALQALMARDKTSG